MCLQSSSSSIEEFPPDPFTDEQRIHGAIIFHLIVGFYCFVLIAFVCNDYFLPSVFCICQGKETLGQIGFTISSNSFYSGEIKLNLNLKFSFRYDWAYFVLRKFWELELSVIDFISKSLIGSLNTK